MSSRIRVLYENLSQGQRMGVLVFSQLLVAVVIALLLMPVFQERNRVDVAKGGEVFEGVPVEMQENFRQTLWQVVSNNVANADKSVVDDVVVREGSYEKTEDEGMRAVNFIIDIDSIKQTYVVSIGWSDDVSKYGPNNVSIECPPASQMKYPETECKGMYNDTYSLSLYLPHAVYPEGHGVESVEPLAPNYIIHGDETSKTIDVEVSVCDAEKYKQEAMEYLKTTPIKLSEYKINYRVNEVDVNCRP